ncbi:hypothetical protein NQ315_009032 [Exocentrus adspersus]|uniref:Uncharacterized protein n=1 Tax=Exocentrus adspersus TaxID=1586481 RepID=A0AAV8VGI5_9CUCU|nr:hypothetical protein NQ315_009032 [Exocentrus adspersus]
MGSPLSPTLFNIYIEVFERKALVWEHRRSIRRRPNARERENLLAPTYLPYVKVCTDIISRLLKKRNINTVFTFMEKIASEFPEMMSNCEDLQDPGVYSIPCACGKMYIWSRQEDKSAMVEHRADTGHTIELEKINK